jgi:pimeloyl-ACP methyl ester carboxylesterase
MHNSNEPKDGVVLLHGMFRTHRSMGGMARFFRANGYTVINVGYPSTRMRVEDIAAHIHPKVEAFCAGVSGKVHFVGYSMGGLVIRAYLHRFRVGNLGRVVMLGTPNQGSEMADVVKNLWLFKKLYGPAGQQLVTAPDNLILPSKAHYELGSIAGNFSIDPLTNYIMGGPNDGKVTVESTKLDGMKDHIVISASHAFFPRNRAARDYALRFLKHGTFTSSHPLPARNHV